MIKFDILDKIREAQNIAVKENIKVNAIQLSKDFVKIPELVTKTKGCVSITPPMLCGLKAYIDFYNELPEEYAFALFQNDSEENIIKSTHYLTFLFVQTLILKQSKKN